MKLYITLSALVVISLFSLLATTDSPRAEDNYKFVIAYSSNVEGYLEPCG
jgi:hypothetical protein